MASTNRTWESPRRRASVLALLLLLWVSPALVVSFRRGSPFLDGVRRVGLAHAEDSKSQEELRQFLAQIEEQVSTRHEVVIWVEEPPRDLTEAGSHMLVWITAAYLLYPRRVFPLSTPEVIQEAETRRLIAPPLAAFMRARVTALANNDPSPTMGILVWTRPPPCRVERAWSHARLLAASRHGGCFFLAGRHEE